GTLAGTLAYKRAACPLPNCLSSALFYLPTLNLIMSEERKKGGRRHRAPKPSDEAYERASKHSGGEDPSFFRGAVQNVLGRRKTEGNDDSDSDGSPPPHHRPVSEEDVESLSRAHEEIYKKS
ncbi:hypothetical protein BC938DRAFT_476753, partial [Jimgerdemannia flammicorona]